MRVRPLYFDYAATTPMCLPALEALYQCLGPKAAFGNPHSTTHFYGVEAAQIVTDSAEQFAALIKAKPRELIWTSGATEANNLAIQGAAQFYAGRGRHLITAATEHHAVLDVFRALEKQGFSLTILPVDAAGLIDLEQLKAALTPETSLVSIMMVNNELGTIQDIQKIAELVKSHGSLLHVDAAQGLCKLPINLEITPVDLMSFSAHKVYGPKGIGALYVRSTPKVHLKPLFYGGGQQLNLRPGTESPGLIAAFTKAVELGVQNQAQYWQKILGLNQQLRQGLAKINDLRFNTPNHHAVPHILNVCFEHTDAELMLARIKNDIALAQGSACTSATIEVSHVLKAIGLTHQQADRSFRFSLSHLTTPEEITKVLDLLLQT